MSKWQLPTQKGTELFPQAIRSPVSVRFEGVPPGSPLARELYQTFRGEIDRFYLKNAQAFALGVVDQRGAHQQVSPALAMRYTNNQGHEIVHVRIEKEAAQRVEERAKLTPWDWVLLEIRVPLTGSALHAALRAQRIIPRAVEPGVRDDGYVYDSLASPLNLDGLTPPVTEYPSDVFDVETTRGDEYQISTLLVDLRRFGGVPVAVDIGGHLAVASEPEEVVVSYSANNIADYLPAPVKTVHPYSYDYNLTDDVLISMSLWPEDVADFTTTGVGPAIGETGMDDVFVLAEDAPRAPLVLDGHNTHLLHIPNFVGATGVDRVVHIENWTDITYDPASGIMTGVTIHRIDVNGPTESVVGHDGKIHAHGSGSYETWTVSAERPVTAHTGTVMMPVPATVAAEARFVGGFGDPPWKTAQVEGVVTTFNQFGIAAEGEVRLLNTAKLRDDVPISGPAEEGGYPVLGTFLVDPVRKAVAFNLA